MKKHALAICTMVLAMSCASGSSDNAPPIGIDVRPVGLASDILYFPGPMSLRFAVAVTNPTNEPVTMTSLQLRNVGPGAFSLRSGAVPVNRTIGPGQTATFTVSAWGYSRGGYMRAEEPVTLRAIGDFRSPSRNSFIKMVTENLEP
ncbi:MAG TPA: hypothetical protein VGR95_01775 [Thermoanaerobaculia bacterium]|nr:hypothetical protein [Thermoanaerobaculia bacterium]